MVQIARAGISAETLRKIITDTDTDLRRAGEFRIRV